MPATTTSKSALRSTRSARSQRTCTTARCTPLLVAKCPEQTLRLTRRLNADGRSVRHHSSGEASRRLTVGA
jgi:hypothetical protein